MVTPFGLVFGTQPSDVFVAVDDFVAASNSVPAPHPDFSTYLLGHSPEVGIAKIIANSSPISGEEYGDTTKRLFEKVRAQLTKKYGEPKLYDFLKPDSIWTEDRDWATSISNRERYLSAVWRRPDVDLPQELYMIGLEAFPGDEGIQLSLTYTGANWPNLQAQMERAELDVL